MRVRIDGSQNITCRIKAVELTRLKEQKSDDFYAQPLGEGFNDNYFYLGYSTDPRFTNIPEQNGVQLILPAASANDPYLCIENSAAYMTFRAEFSIWIILKFCRITNRIIHNLTDEGWNKLESRRELSQRYKGGSKLFIFIE